MLWRHVAEVNQDTDGMRMNFEQRRALPSVSWRFLQISDRAACRNRADVRLGEIKTGERLVGDVPADGGCKRCVAHEIRTDRMDGERAR